MNMQNNYKLLIVDDENDIAELIKDVLSEDNYEITIANNQYQAIEILNKQDIDLVLLDIWLEDQNDGIELLKEIKIKNSEIQVVMVSGHGNINIATKAIKFGAYDYIEKPFNSDKLKIIVRRALEHYGLKKTLKDRNILANKFIEIIGSSKLINNIRLLADSVAKSDARVFINGENGVGKEIIARYIHKKSKYANDNFTIITPSNPLVFNNFNNINLSGTIFIDEITDFPLYFQKSLLFFINSSKFGSFRLITSNSKNIDNALESGLFNTELYDRLNIISINVPSLKDRISDIPELCKFFINYFVESAQLNFKEFDESLIYKLQAYNWPGNITQLKSIIEWLLITSNHQKNKEIDASMLVPDILNKMNNSGFDIDKLSMMQLKEAREEFEKYYLNLHLRRNNGSISKTAEIISMDRSALHRKLKNLGIDCE